MKRAAQDGLICFGPQLGKEQTFVLLDEWAPDISSEIYLLPAFDEYSLGYKDRIVVVDKQHAKKIYRKENYLSLFYMIQYR